MQAESSFLTCRLQDVEVGLERDEDECPNGKTRRFPTVITVAAPREAQGAIVSSDGQTDRFQLAASSAAAFAMLASASLARSPVLSSCPLQCKAHDVARSFVHANASCSSL